MDPGSVGALRHWFMEDGQAADIDFRVAELAARALDLLLPDGDSGFILPVIERG